MIDYPIFYDLKTFSDIDKTVKIMKIEVHCLRTNIIFLGTSNGLYILNLNAYLLPKFHTNPNFKALVPISKLKEWLNEEKELKISESYK